MSQDLFAAFGGESTRPTESSVANVDDDDDFGDFEDASAPAAAEEQPKPKYPFELKSSIQNKSTNGQRRPEQSIPKATQAPAPKEEPKQSGSHPFAGRMDLLFEAGDDEYDAGADELADLSTNPEAAMAYSKKLIAEQEASQVKKEAPTPTASKSAPTKAPAKKFMSSHSRNASNPDSGPKKLRKKSGYVPAQEPEVLFDAEDVSNHDDSFDDFGDFETESSTPQGVTPIARVERPAAVPAIDLLGLDDAPVWNDNDSHTHRRTQSKPMTQQPRPVVQPRPPQEEDDAWDDFETAAPTSPPPPSHDSQHVRTSSQLQSTSTLPPTNVPPPAVLLSIFPSLFASADEALFSTMSKLDLKQRQIVLAHPASHQFLKGYLGHCVVLAHIIAGRKLRWKRDQHLSQSMRIGPSAAGGKSGMKLTGVDKSEVAKEDREVLDTLDLWKVQVGKLRTAVTAASAAPGLPKLPSVPEIAEQMPVRTLKQSEGGLTAPHACALCGLRREERVSKVDVEVEDSFGEWWVQGMNMHVSCKNFWEEFEKKLKSR